MVDKCLKIDEKVVISKNATKEEKITVLEFLEEAFKHSGNKLWRKIGKLKSYYSLKGDFDGLD